MMRRSLAAIFSVTLMSSAGWAADVAPVPVPDWTGFYLGVHGGYGFGDQDWTLVDNPGRGTPASLGDEVASPDLDGFLGGAQVGFNYQIDSLVLGLEGEFAFADISGSESRNAGGEGEGKPGPRKWSSDMNWMATVGPRLGYDWTGTLLYAEGGLAIVDQDFYHLGAAGGGEGGEGEEAAAEANRSGREFKGSDTTYGWFIGAGVEQSFAENFSARIEYNFIQADPGDQKLFGEPENPAIFDIDQNIHVIKVGLNYRFPM